MADTIAVELVFALPDQQLLLTLEVSDQATVADVISASGVRDRFPDVAFDELPVGIWGRPVEREQLVRAGDRVELYRPLQIDPREARRRLAEAGRTMAFASGEDPLRGSD